MEDPRPLRDSLTEKLGYPCPVGLLDIKRAVERFSTTELAEAYLLGYCENRTRGDGYHVDHRGQVIANGRVAAHIRSLESEIRKTDLYVIGLERSLAAQRSAGSG